MASESIPLDASQPGAVAENEPDAVSNAEVTQATPTPESEAELEPDMDSNEDGGRYVYRYCPGPDYCEDMEMYQTGGLHPVQIQDLIENRYLVIHKLGSGGSAIVWLARDTKEERYVALKIVAANRFDYAEDEAAIYRKLHDSLTEDVREAFLLPLYDTFWIEGPNGRHLCLSMGISGPSLASFRHVETMKIRPDLVNIVAAQVVEGLSELHKVGLVYGDLSAGNIAFTLPNLDHFSVEDIYNIFGEPKEYDVQTAKQSQMEWGKIHAPGFVYLPMDFTGKTQVGLLKPEVKFIDFGSSYFASSTEIPADLGHTISYSDPECLYFDDITTQESDVWALACILFELRSAAELFPQEGSGGFPEFEARLGAMPQEWDEENEADEEGANMEDIEEVDEPLGGEDSAKDDNDLPVDDRHADGSDALDDHASVDAMELTEQSLEHSSSDQEGSAAQPQEAATISPFLPKKLDELIGRLLMSRAESLMVSLGVDAWKQRGMDVLSSVSSWFQKSPVNESVPPKPTLSPPESPLPYRRFRPVIFRHRGRDPTLHGQIANIGNHHPWHSLTIEERRERLDRYNERYSEFQMVDTSDEGLDRGPPPPGKLSAEESADLEDLLTKMLTWKRSDRATLDDIREHPWLTKTYAPSSSEHWLQPYYLGQGYYGVDEVYIG